MLLLLLLPLKRKNQNRLTCPRPPHRKKGEENQSPLQQRPLLAPAQQLHERARRGAGVGVVGGAGGSLVSEGGPRLVDTDFPEEFKAEALEMIGVLDDLRETGSAHDWFFIHPAGGFG